MNFFKKYYLKLFFKQWGIGISEGNIENIIREKKSELKFKWVEIEDKSVSYADPFIYKSGDGQFHLLFESFSSQKQDGNISLFVFDSGLNLVLKKLILSENYHLSYPFIYKENDKIYVFPEAAESGSLFCYEYDPQNKEFINKTKVLDMPVIDPTILKYADKYWLFCTLIGEHRHSKLYIFYSDHLTGPYKSHLLNPVKNGLNGSRPAGAFIIVDNEIYRPSQNCGNYYGESLTINKIVLLTEKEFKEEIYMNVFPEKNTKFRYGLHTINAANGVIVADGLAGYFQPFGQLFKKMHLKP